MQQPPQKRKLLSNRSPAPSPSPATSNPPHSRGQIHVKLIQARGLNVRTPSARPYVVVQFEQNEFISRDPTDETDKEVKGIPTNRPSALSALGAIGSKVAAHAASRKGSKSSNGSSSPISSTRSSITSLTTPTAPVITTSTTNLFGRLPAHNPVWKHEVSFDVTTEDSQITCMVYDRAVSDQGFLGTVKIKPVLIHDHTVDDWYKLQPVEHEVVSGQIRVQVTFEQYKTRRALTPRDFEFLKLIGVGTFGKVFQVRKKDTRRIYAMKVLSKKEIVAKKEVAHTIGERKILQRSLESPFLVGLKFSFQTDTELYLVTDFKSGGELFWHLQRETRFTEERARFYIAELTLALEHLHKYNIVYRDLKPENILLDATGHVALCDFGLSKADLRPDELTTTFCGTTEYLAPEILLDEQGYSKIVDFWSLGVLLFEMCCGWSPFYAEDIQQMYKNICFGKIRFPKGVICEDGKQFVKGLLNRNPKHRLGAKRDAAELKEHPFFSGIDWEALARKDIAPPFKPVVESDESVNNFDPEFTSADISNMSLEDELDDDDPSEAWVSRSINQNGFVHTPNGPLGSERRSRSGSTSSSTSQRGGGGAFGLGPLSTLNGNGTGNGITTSAAVATNGHHAPILSTTNGAVTSPTVTSVTATTSPTGSQGIQIKSNKKRKEVAGTPLTNSVQENFRGFTYSGGESVVVPPGVLAQQAQQRAKDEQAVEDDDEPEVTTEDEVEDTRMSAGRYANMRRKGLGFSAMDDDL
ncbi:Pkinase-domain-containing protein [Macrolepiota fuliginosa MF-IS2]|uniref:Pkinase-domain-containing protein n=1 Tax=Macrolepiota fuliginosa MF-IS2 TaxID=1400762 RepID=A0A9P5XGF6_9AGAR|nr:Pkinase-domain-containing protein [Macrolepiota fuliginosa MF-IS2]